MFRPSLVPSLVIVISCLLAGPAQALSPEAARFIRSIGLDPGSEAVRLADADGTMEFQIQGDPERFSLEALAMSGRAGAVRRFIVTRAFVHRLKVDFAGTVIPKEDYQADFLTREEKQLVGRKVADEIGKGRF